MMCSGWDYITQYTKKNIKARLWLTFSVKIGTVLVKWMDGWMGVNSCDNSLYTKFTLQNWVM